MTPSTEHRGKEGGMREQVGDVGGGLDTVTLGHGVVPKLRVSGAG